MGRCLACRRFASKRMSRIGVLDEGLKGAMREFVSRQKTLASNQYRVAASVYK